MDFREIYERITSVAGGVKRAAYWGIGIGVPVLMMGCDTVGNTHMDDAREANQAGAMFRGAKAYSKSLNEFVAWDLLGKLSDDYADQERAEAILEELRRRPKDEHLTDIERDLEETIRRERAKFLDRN